jgi:transposase
LGRGGGCGLFHGLEALPWMPVSTPATWVIRNGPSSNPSCIAPTLPGGGRPLHDAASLMPSSPCCAPAPSGACCHPPRWAVSYHSSQWRQNGTWENVTRALRESYRRTIGRAPQPTAAIIGSQSVRTSEMGGPRGYDGGKKVKGRKRHLLVDPQGTLLKGKVHPADIHDRSGAELLLPGLQHLFPAIKLVWADTASRGLKDWLATALGWRPVDHKALVDGIRGVDEGWIGAADATERFSCSRASKADRANLRLAHH